MTFGVAESSQGCACCAVHSPEMKAGAAELLKTLQLPAADVPMVQQLATAKQVQRMTPHAKARRPVMSNLLNSFYDVTHTAPQACLWHMQVLAEDVLPALKHAPSSHPDSTPAVDFACLPLGFTTGGDCSQTADVSAIACHCSCSLGLLWPQNPQQRLSSCAAAFFSSWVAHYFYNVLQISSWIPRPQCSACCTSKTCGSFRPR